MRPLHSFVHTACQAEIIGGEDDLPHSIERIEGRVDTGRKPDAVLDMGSDPRTLHVRGLDMCRAIPGGQRSLLFRRVRRVGGMDQVGVPDHPRASRKPELPGVPPGAARSRTRPSRRAISVFQTDDVGAGGFRQRHILSSPKADQANDDCRAKRTVGRRPLPVTKM